MLANPEQITAAIARARQTPRRKEAEKLIADYLADIAASPYSNDVGDAKKLPTGKRILASSLELQAAVYLHLLTVDREAMNALWWAVQETNRVPKDLVFSDDEMIELLATDTNIAPIRHLENYRQRRGDFPDLVVAMLRDIQARHFRSRFAGNDPESRPYALIAKLLGDTLDTSLPYADGQAWTNRAIADLQSVSTKEQSAWQAFLVFAVASDGSKPPKGWANTAKQHIAAIGADFFPALERWMPLVSTPPYETERVNRASTHYGHVTEWTETVHHIFYSDRNISILKGFAWACAGRTEPEIARALEKMAVGCLAKVPGTGPWAVRAANAAVYALAESPDNPEAVPSLARLKSKIIYRPVLAQIEKALDAAAQRQGVSKDDLEDLSVPTYGLTENGVRRETFDTDSGAYAVEMRVGATGDVTLSYFAPDGKSLKSAPAAIKTGDNAEAFKELKADADAAGKTLTAQKARFDGFYLAQRGWRYADFVERFITHPLLAQIAHRLIWHFAENNTENDGVYDAATGGFANANGTMLPVPSPDATVSLWHPLGFAPEYVLGWRDRLATLGIVQPFKQAHREVYLLTDAELATRTYSNRFAGHLLKQHQMNALAHGRGWKNPLRLMVDNSCPPATRDLPLWNLRAEYWIEGAGDNYGVDTNDTGTFLYLTTDQVRFYPLSAPQNWASATGGGYIHDGRGVIPAPLNLPLSEIPSLVFSEIMRDVDLFVGVASVGNDPTWEDSGTAPTTGRYSDYWKGYAFGELSASAQTRAEVLTKLLPRLKIASRCEIDGRYLIVRGDVRTYRIHLGSANILMEPNDQYLCIVSGQSKELAEGTVFLPFEGDARLSVILSKAFLLADDKKITDPTIVSQIKRP